MILIDDTSYTYYQSIMQAAHSIVETCMPRLLIIDTVTAHIIYILICYLLIMHIPHDIDLSWSLPWPRSLMHACCLVKMLSIYNNDTVHMAYVTMLSTDHAYTNMTLNTYACYQSMDIHWNHKSLHVIDLWCILFILSDVCYICSRQVLHTKIVHK